MVCILVSIKRIKKWSNRALGCHDKLFSSREHTIGPRMKRSLFVSYVFLTTECMDDLFEISSLSVKKSIHYSIWNSQMTRISKISLPFSIFDIDNSEKPVFFSYKILVYSPLHTDEVVCMRIFIFCRESTILGTISDFFETCRHISHSRRYFVIRKSRSECIW